MRLFVFCFAIGPSEINNINLRNNSITIHNGIGVVLGAIISTIFGYMQFDFL